MTPCLEYFLNESQSIGIWFPAVPTPRLPSWWKHSGGISIPAWRLPRRSVRRQRDGSSEKSVAVLPFVNMSEDRRQHFSDGLSEELINLLTKIPDLRIPARTSSFFFKGKQTTVTDIAKSLGVAYIMEGSVRKSGNRLRITAQLIRANNGYHVWSERTTASWTTSSRSRTRLQAPWSVR